MTSRSFPESAKYARSRRSCPSNSTSNSLEVRVQDMGMPSMRRSVFTTGCLIVLTLLFVATGSYLSSPQVQLTLLDELPPHLDHMLARMMAYRQWQDNALREYHARRRFHASNPRFNMDSTLDVQTVFHWPHSLQSTIIKQEGSDFIREHVFEKILEAESNLAENDQADVIPKNYDFTIMGKEDCQGRACWRLAIKPKRKDRFLIDGEMWLDAADYAVTRVHGTPSKNPSMWISRVEIERRLCRIDGVWLTDKIESSSSIRLAGNVGLSIEYTYDKVNVLNAGASRETARAGN
jgi:hypothetical protein